MKLVNPKGRAVDDLKNTANDGCRCESYAYRANYHQGITCSCNCFGAYVNDYHMPNK